MELITYDFVEEFVLNYLGNLFKSKCKNDEIYTNHSLENLDYFRTIKKENLTIKEEDRFIQLTISLNMNIPKIQIIINKDNNRLCRVYVNNDPKKFLTSFDIDDEQIINLLNLDSQKVINIETRINQIKEAEKENPILVPDIDTRISEFINRNKQRLVDQMVANFHSTYYGFCLIIYYGKITIKQTRYRFVKETMKKEQNYDEVESVKLFIQNSLEDFIKKQEKK